MKKGKWVVSVAIALILALFVGYGIEVFDDSPNREDFCGRNLYMIENEQECIDSGGEWGTQGIVPKPVEGEQREFCHETKECFDEFDSARNSHDRIVFIVALIIGIVSIVVGILLKMDTVGVGVLAGGLLLILYGTIRYWEHANDILKFILLGIVLAVLIWVTYKKIDKK